MHLHQSTVLLSVAVRNENSCWWFWHLAYPAFLDTSSLVSPVKPKKCGSVFPLYSCPKPALTCLTLQPKPNTDSILETLNNISLMDDGGRGYIAYNVKRYFRTPLKHSTPFTNCTPKVLFLGSCLIFLFSLWPSSSAWLPFSLLPLCCKIFQVAPSIPFAQTEISCLCFFCFYPAVSLWWALCNFF